jgi:hypothetical protein
MKPQERVNERQILDKALALLQERLDGGKVRVQHQPVQRLGRRPDAVADLAWAGGKARLVLEGKAYLHPSLLQGAVEQVKALAEKDEIPVIVAPYLDPAKRESLRASGVCYLDASGNCFLKAKGLLVVTESDAAPLRPAGKKPSLFSDKGARILKSLLLDRRRGWRVRDLAEASGASLGMTWKLMSALREAGYSGSEERDGFRLMRVEEVLSEWVEFYRFERVNRSAGYYFPAPTPAEAMAGFHRAAAAANLAPYAFTLHAAGRIADPFVEGVEVNHVYVSGEVSLWASKLKLIEAREPNLVLVQPYYKTAVFADAQEARGGLKLVSDLQLFLDFFNHPLRGREAAEHLFDKRLGKSLGIERFF